MTLRLAERSDVPDSESPWDLRERIDRLGDRLGEASLPELIAEAGALAELHLVKLALRRTGGGAEAAALLLGIGRERLARVLIGASADGDRVGAGHDEGDQ